MSPANLERHVQHYATLTAIHEAAHVVVHVKSGVRLISVDVLPRERRMGYTVPEPGMTDAQAAVGAFAGCVGEIVAGNLDCYVEATDRDVGQAVFSCFQMCGGTLGSETDAEGLMSCIMREWDRTVAMIIDPVTFAKLHFLAGALLANGRLTHDQIVFVFNSIEKPDRTLARNDRIAKETLTEIRRLVPQAAGRWLSNDGRRLRDGAFEVA